MTPTDANREAVEVVLLPCPFCNDSRVILIRPASGAHPYALCQGCAAGGSPQENDERAAAVWNQRPTTAHLTAERDALRERCERLADLVMRAQSNVPSCYINWQEDARAALASEDRHGG